ncbi:MAG: hypothetical protein PHG06_21240 [Parabacteroides sp.]|nr:hypothetical protein [Parabacteroides sp.]
MIEFLTQYWDSILVVVLFITICIVLVRKGSSRYVKQMLFYLVTQAEAEYGSGTGDLKYAAVTTWLYERIPAILKFFFSAKQIDAMIESAVDQMKEYLMKNASAQAFVVTTNAINNVVPIAVPKKE